MTGFHASRPVPFNVFSFTEASAMLRWEAVLGRKDVPEPLAHGSVTGDDMEGERDDGGCDRAGGEAGPDDVVLVAVSALRD